MIFGKNRRIAELEARISELEAENEDNTTLICRLGDLLDGTINALRGTPALMRSHSTHDIVQVAEKVVQERDHWRAIAEDKHAQLEMLRKRISEQGFALEQARQEAEVTRPREMGQ